VKAETCFVQLPPVPIQMSGPSILVAGVDIHDKVTTTTLTPVSIRKGIRIVLGLFYGVANATHTCTLASIMLALVRALSVVVAVRAYIHDDPSCTEAAHIIH
jgi:hypothetical protein